MPQIGGAGGMARAPVRAFTYLGTRSPSIVLALGAVTAVEIGVLHLWLAARHPAAAWTITLLGIASLAWIVADYRAVARRPIVMGSDVLHVRVGRRFDATIPLAQIAAAALVTWRTVPPRAKDYLNTAGLSEPNVVIHFSDPVPVRILDCLTRPVTRLGLRLDDPDGFVDALGSSSRAGAEERKWPHMGVIRVHLWSLSLLGLLDGAGRAGGHGRVGRVFAIIRPGPGATAPTEHSVRARTHVCDGHRGDAAPTSRTAEGPAAAGCWAEAGCGSGSAAPSFYSY